MYPKNFMLANKISRPAETRLRHKPDMKKSGTV